MIELMRRTPGERAAYLAGYEAGIRAGCEVIAKIAEATALATTDMQTKVALMLVLAGADIEE